MDAPEALGTPLDWVVILVYFVLILGFGALFGRHARSTQDFFFAGRRFPWWLIAVSLVASMVGSYSFIKYSQKAYEYGLSSTYTYLNDAPWMPLFVLVWLPMIYFGRIGSVPEYMQRRFGAASRLAAVAILLVYMVGYIGFNLYTIGVGMQGMLGLDPLLAAAAVGVVCAVYVTAGGQTSVVMTDLVQGVILLVAGVVLLLLGAAAVGGLDELWRLLGPGSGGPELRRALPPFNQPRDFNFVGIFWQDGMANNLAALLINQGMIMRFLAARSLRHGQKAALVMTLAFMPVAALAVSGGGWVGAAMHRAGLLEEVDSAQVFVTVADMLCGPGVFGLMMAALIAALMSTADTLINAVAAVWVNDLWRPYLVRGRPDRHYLQVARVVSVLAALLGIAFVPLFMQFDLYEAHGAFTACVTPPLAVALLLGVCWKRPGGASALAALVGGSVAVAATLPFPQLLVPVSLAIGGGPEPSNYTRAAFGLLVSGLLGVVVALLARPATAAQVEGLTAARLAAARRAYKGGTPKDRRVRPVRAVLEVDEALADEDDAPFVSARLGPDLAEALGAEVGDVLYVGPTSVVAATVRGTHARVVGLGAAAGTVVVGPVGRHRSGMGAGSRLEVELQD